MSGQDDWLRIIVLLATLAFVLSGFASYRLNWGKTLTLVLVWGAIITAVALFIAVVRV